MFDYAGREASFFDIAVVVYRFRFVYYRVSTVAFSSPVGNKS